MYPTVTVIVPVLNGETFLPMQLASLQSQDYKGPWDIVVVDNGSKDSSRLVLAEFQQRFPRMTIARAARRGGVGHARNVGVAHARGELLAFCDQDDFASVSWLSGLVYAARSADLVSGPNQPTIVNSARTRRWRPSWTPDSLAGAQAPFCFGNNMAIWRRVLAALGGWPEDYWHGGEDKALSWRALQAGYTLGFAPTAVMHYRHRSRIGASLRQAFRYGRAEKRLRNDPRYAQVGYATSSSAMNVPEESGQETGGVWWRALAYRVGSL